MLALINLLPCSAVTFSQSYRSYFINDASFLSPQLLSKRQNLIPQSSSKPLKLRSNHEIAIRFPSKSTSRTPYSAPKINFAEIYVCPIQFPSLIPKSATSDVPQESSPDAESQATKKPDKRLKLALVFGFWYLQNVIFNIYNKKALNIFPFPWLLASFQLFVGSVWMLFLWSFKLQPCPKISKSFIVALLGPALFHTIGHISACVSFSKVAVSFTHVIKSSEPVFSVIFSTFLGDSYPLTVWLSIIPIVLGCSLAAITEVSFNFQGLSGALISNVGFVLRNIYSKKSLQSFKEVDGLNLYGWISIVSLIYLFPVAIFVEGSQWLQGYHRAVEAIGKPMTFYIWVLLSGVFYHLYNQSSYQALDEISPLTFSVGNTMKRVVVIVSSVIVFRNAVRPLNALGTAIAVLGTFLYSQATAAQKPKKTTS